MKPKFPTIKVWIWGGWIWDEFHSTFFQHKNGQYSVCVFLYGKRRKFHHVMEWISKYIFYLFTGYKFLTKNRWFLRCDFHLFMGYKFLTKNRWFLRRDFHLFMGYKFLTKNRWFLMHDFHLFTGYKFLTKNRWFLRHDFHLFMGYKFLTKNRWFLRCDFHLFTGYESLVQNGHFMDDFLTFREYDFHSVIYWNSCLTRVWILGTKRVFNGWISDLHRVWFSLCYILKFMLNGGMNPWYKTGILWMNFWPSQGMIFTLLYAEIHA